MNNSSEFLLKGEEKHSTVLLTLTTIFAFLYLIFIIDNFISEPHNLESTVVKLAFIIFLIGYYYSWKNEMIAGIVFIFWWGIMWYLGLLIAEHDKGASIVMGLPMFIIGIIFIVSRYRRRERTTKN
jgi:ABC-type sulfate transport system permease subunit